MLPGFPGANNNVRLSVGLKLSFGDPSQMAKWVPELIYATKSVQLSQYTKKPYT